MRYWLLHADGQGADGPFEVAELRSRPGFTPDTVVAPEDAQTVDAWKPASAYADLGLLFFKPPPMPPPHPRLATPAPHPASPAPRPQNTAPQSRPATSVPAPQQPATTTRTASAQQAPASAAQTSPTAAKLQRRSLTWIGLATVIAAVLGGTIFALSRRSTASLLGAKSTQAIAAAQREKPSSAKEKELEDLRRFKQEASTKGSLGEIRTALSIFYGDAEGSYPEDLDVLTANRKYLKSIPSAATGHHPPSNSVVYVCGDSGKTVPDRLRDSGGWAYCDMPGSIDFGTLFVDCTHKDSRGTAWYAN